MNESINLCFVDMMHYCSFDGWSKQMHCSFREKNSNLEICRHFQCGEFCQNLDAYPTARTVRVKEHDLPKKVDRGDWPELVVISEHADFKPITPELWGSTIVREMNIEPPMKINFTIFPDLWIKEIGRYLSNDLRRNKAVENHIRSLGFSPQVMVCGS